MLALNLLTPQPVHCCDDMLVTLNVPATQAATLLPLPVYPALAMQSECVSDAAMLLEFAGQPLQALCAALSWKNPPGQLVQAVDASLFLKYPARHVLHALAPVPSCHLPNGHAKQTFGMLDKLVTSIRASTNLPLWEHTPAPAFD